MIIEIEIKTKIFFIMKLELEIIKLEISELNRNWNGGVIYNTDDKHTNDASMRLID